MDDIRAIKGLTGHNVRVTTGHEIHEGVVWHVVPRTVWLIEDDVDVMVPCAEISELVDLDT